MLNCIKVMDNTERRWCKVHQIEKRQLGLLYLIFADQSADRLGRSARVSSTSGPTPVAPRQTLNDPLSGAI
jgi:hypothetical protein